MNSIINIQESAISSMQFNLCVYPCLVLNKYELFVSYALSVFMSCMFAER